LGRELTGNVEGGGTTREGCTPRELMRKRSRLQVDYEPSLSEELERGPWLTRKPWKVRTVLLPGREGHRLYSYVVDLCRVGPMRAHCRVYRRSAGSERSEKERYRMIIAMND
jgi:hypothetical protein